MDIKPPPERNPAAPFPGPNSLRCCHPQVWLGCSGSPSIESCLHEWTTAREFELGASTASKTERNVARGECDRGNSELSSCKPITGISKQIIYQNIKTFDNSLLEYQHLQESKNVKKLQDVFKNVIMH